VAFRCGTLENEGVALRFRGTISRRVWLACTSGAADVGGRDTQAARLFEEMIFA
jgi:hypothetical protein